MSEKEPQPAPAELRLEYEEGWQELFEATDPAAVECQLWMGMMAQTTHKHSQALEVAPGWADDEKLVLNRWMRAIELVAGAAIDLQDELTPVERVEAALITFQTDLTELDWEEPGLRFTVPDLLTLEPTSIDLRELSSFESNA